MDIFDEFFAWLDGLFEENEMPAETKAYNFNLYDESDDENGNIYSVQLIAADEFDESDDEWPCCEVWSSEEDIFCIDTSDEPDTGRDRAEDFISELVKEYLASGRYREILTSAEAVGIGFVDGDLTLLYTAEE